MTGEEVAKELIDVLSINLGISCDLLIAAMRDRASVNDGALRMLSVVYPGLLDVGCFSHALDLVGSRFSAPTLENFVSLWISLFPIALRAISFGRHKQVGLCKAIARLGGGVVGKSCT